MQPRLSRKHSPKLSDLVTQYYYESCSSPCRGDMGSGVLLYVSIIRVPIRVTRRVTAT